MKNWQSLYRILPLMTLMGLMLMSYNHCLHPEQSPKKKPAQIESNLSNTTSTSTPTANTTPPPSGVFQERIVSLRAFEQTVYRLTTQHCILCHAALQQPLHASPSIEMAHDQLRDNLLVNFSNVNNSRMVLKLRQELHNCWGGSCENSAQQMAQAISEWGNIIEEAQSAFQGNGSQTAPEPTQTRLITADSMSFNQTMNNQSMYGSGTMAINLHSASLRSPMILTSSNGTQVITTPINAGTINNPTNINAGIAYFNFNVTQADDYTMWARLNAPSTNSDSFFVRLNNSAQIYEWHTGVTNGFQWRKLSHGTNRLDAPIYLPQGPTNRLEIIQREAGTQIAEIIFTNDEGFDPSMDDFRPQVTMSYDLSNLLGGITARFEVDVEDYNAWAYRFSRPRIQFSSGTLKVKKLNILVNNQMNPQNSTYTLVDRTITPQDNLLSNSSMIVLKDYGNDQDVFSFEFEVLEP
jgi:hypothetical protein